MNCENIHKGEEKAVSLPDTVPQLNSLYLYLSGSCNLACKHCWISPVFSQKSDSGSSLPMDYIRSAITQAKPLGLRSVKLTGGEPLLHPEFKEIVELVAAEDLLCPIETNGTLIDEDMSRFLASKANNVFISVSIDGAREETHEALRGVKGSYKASIDALKHLVKYGLKPQVICSLHSGNKAEVADVVHLAEDIGCGTVKFNLIQEIGRGNTYKQKFGFNVEQTLELHDYVENTLVPKSHIDIYFDIPQAFFSMKRYLRNNVGRCNILNILGVLHTGELSICGVGTSVPDLIFGHIDRDNLREVWTKSLGLQKLRDNIPDNFKGICYSCIHRNNCLGSCIANTYVRTGSLNKSYSFCEDACKLGLFPTSRKRKEKEHTI